jgi:hypothetical protein
MRLLESPAQLAEAAALVRHRSRQLGQRGILLPSHHVAAFTHPRKRAVGLYEADVLHACLLLDRQPEPCPGDTFVREPSLGISHAFTAPGPETDLIGRLLTFWVSDFAARSGAMTVHADAPTRRTDAPDGAERLLAHLTDLGWFARGPGLDKDGRRITRLMLGAQERASLAAIVRCTVPVHAPQPALQDREAR